MTLVLVLPVVAIAAFFVVVCALDFKSEKGTTWQRVLAAGRGSATIVWMRLGVIFSALTSALVSAAGYFNLPEVQTALQKYMTPEAWLAVLAVFAVIGEIARRRSL